MRQSGGEEEEGRRWGLSGKPNKQNKPLSLIRQLLTPLVTGQCTVLQICAAGGRNNTGLKKQVPRKCKRKVSFPQT